MSTLSSTAPFHLDDDQREIQAMARQFADDRIAPGAIEWDEEKRLPVDVLREAAELGLGAIYCDEEFGGSGMTRLDAALIFEALGTGCPTIAAYTSIHNMATWMIDSFGTREQRARWVPGLATMETLGAYCLTEAGRARTPRRSRPRPAGTAITTSSTGRSSSSPARARPAST
jgi:alkylation response protein AidB-like acyl-CoA dehydrogenase